MMTKTKDPIEAAREHARLLITRRRELFEDGLGAPEIRAHLEQLGGQIFVRTLLKPEDEEVVIEEAVRRHLRCLSWVDDAQLLEEVERRGLSAVKTNMAKQEFEREAHQRGYRRSLANFPMSEIASYLRIQGVEPGGK